MKPLPPEIRQEVNRASHRMALRYEHETQQALLAKVKVLNDDGLALPRLFLELESIEATPKLEDELRHMRRQQQKV